MVPTEPSGAVQPSPASPASATPFAPFAAPLGAMLACGLVLIELGVSGPVGPGPVATLVGAALSVLFPGVPAIFFAWVAGRVRPLRPSGAVLLGAALAWALLPMDPVAWAMAGAATIGALTLPSRWQPALLAGLAGVHALTTIRIPAGDPTSTTPSVVLVTLAGVGEGADLPALDRLARSGVAFADATSPIADESAAIGALLSGRAPWEPLGERGAVQWAQSQGHVTAAFLPESMATPGMQRVDFEDTWLVGARYLPLGRLLGPREVRRADMTVDRALWWMRRQRRPFLAWVHLGDLTRHLDPPPPFDERFGVGSDDPVEACSLDVPLPSSWADIDRRYRGTIAFVDYALQTLVDGVRRFHDDVVIVVVGTHGLDVRPEASCGERAGTPVDWRVPLVVSGGEWPVGKVVSGPIETQAVVAGVMAEQGPVWESAQRGQSGQSAARSLSRLEQGWVASAGNGRGRATVGAVQAWSWSSASLPEEAVRSLLEAQARRALLSVSDVDPTAPSQ